MTKYHASAETIIWKISHMGGGGGGREIGNLGWRVEERARSRGERKETESKK